MENVTEGKPNVEKLTADELEEGVNQLIEGMDKAIAEADEMIFRAKLGDLPNASIYITILIWISCYCS